MSKTPLNEDHIKTLKEVRRLLRFVDPKKISSSELNNLKRSVGRVISHLVKFNKPELNSTYLMSGSMPIASFARCSVGSTAHYLLNFKERSRYEVTKSIKSACHRVGSKCKIKTYPILIW